MPSSSGNTTTGVRFSLLRDHADEGGLIGLSWHVGNPFTGGNVNDRDGVDLPQLADPTAPRTPAGTRWKAELDRIADVLQTFADMDAVVVFRPLHESNGDWFGGDSRIPPSSRPPGRGCSAT